MWQIPVNDMKIGEQSIFVGDSRKKAVLNSFYQYITLPAEEFQIFKDNVQSKIRITRCNEITGVCFYPGKCATQSRNLLPFKI